MSLRVRDLEFVVIGDHIQGSSGSLDRAHFIGRLQGLLEQGGVARRALLGLVHQVGTGFDNGIGDLAGDELDGADGVVVGGIG